MEVDYIKKKVELDYFRFFADFEIERDIRFNQFSIIIIILGLGIFIITGESEELEMLIDKVR